MMDKVTGQCPQNTTFFGRERRAEADLNRGRSACQPNALPLGQTGSLGLGAIYPLCLYRYVRALVVTMWRLVCTPHHPAIVSHGISLKAESDAFQQLDIQQV